jgi:signal transduction histidine kinase
VRLRADDLVTSMLPAVILLALGLGGTHAAAQNQPDALRSPDSIAYTLIVIAVLAVAARRVAPVPMVLIGGVAIASYLGAGYPFGPILLTGPVVVLGLVERSVSSRLALATSATFVAGTSIAAAPALFRHGEGGALRFVAWVLAWSAVVVTPAAVAVAVRTRRQSAIVIAEEQARRALSEERLLMAQDLHDSVGHGLAVIAMQAGVAMHVLDREPDRARESLQAIRDASREALTGLRGQIEELRSPASAGSARRPLQGLADIPGLVERMRGGGIVVDLATPSAGGIPDDVGYAAYRIVQEALTNVLRHGDGGVASVSIVATGRELEVAVVNTRSVTMTRNPSGSGIPGMHARAESVGGTLHAGPRSSGGFEVRAVLPIDRDGGGA